jgi:hypothetical protein
VETMRIGKLTIFTFALAFLAGVAGCARINDKGMRLFSTKVDALAIIGEQLLQGGAVLLPDRTGTVSLEGATGPITSCSGSMRYTGTNSGAIDLRCDDGSAHSLAFTQLSDTRAYAYGAGNGLTVSLVLGLDPRDAKAYLRVPAGMKLVERADGGLAMAPVAP